MYRGVLLTFIVWEGLSSQIKQHKGKLLALLTKLIIFLYDVRAVTHKINSYIRQYYVNEKSQINMNNYESSVINCRYLWIYLWKFFVVNFFGITIFQ